jgi:hypothetical protein
LGELFAFGDSWSFWSAELIVYVVAQADEQIESRAFSLEAQALGSSDATLAPATRKVEDAKLNVPSLLFFHT